MIKEEIKAQPFSLEEKMAAFREIDYIDQSLPMLVLLSISNYNNAVREVENETGLLLNEVDLVSKILDLIHKEETAIEELQYYCLELVHDHNHGALFREFEMFLEFLLRLGEDIYRNAKIHGLYRRGRLAYKFDRFLFGSVVIRRKDSYYETLRNEFSRIT
jgi:8-oxo-dGTP pyrophosphatase MutT (NUDIX family)